MILRCPDCQVEPGAYHVEGCDVSRCSECGFQLLVCDCSNGSVTLWTGVWPGVVEVKVFGLKDLNELYDRAAQGLLLWDKTTHEWVLPSS